VRVVGGGEKLAHIVWDRDHAEVPGEGIRQAKGVTAGRAIVNAGNGSLGCSSVGWVMHRWCLAGSRVLPELAPVALPASPGPQRRAVAFGQPYLRHAPLAPASPAGLSNASAVACSPLLACGAGRPITL